MFTVALCASVICLVTGSIASAEPEKKPNLVEDTYFSIGVGGVVHVFSKTDDFRAGLFEGFNGDDEITWMPGFQFNAELNLNSVLSLSLPIGIAPGYRMQYLTITREYTYYGGYSVSGDITQKLSYMNHIAYLDFLLPLGSKKYFIIGAEVGCGLSTFTYKTSGTGLPSTTDTANGRIFPVGAFFDWGADGVGGRFGFNHCFASFNKIEDSRPSFDGNQFYVNFRYAF